MDTDKNYSIETGDHGTSCRLEVSNEESERGIQMVDKLKALFADQRVSEVTHLEIGSWGKCWEIDSSSVVEALVESADRLPNLTSLKLGDMTWTDCELSWIKQSNVEPFWEAFPNLEYLNIRGGNGLSLGTIRHQRLKRLDVFSTGLDGSVVRQIAAAELPALENLELGLGCSPGGSTVTIDDVIPILHGFPALKRLFLYNSEISDDIAVAIANAPILDTLEEFSLSEGTLSDRGGAALLASPKILNLKKLDLNWHYMSEEMTERFVSLPIEVDIDEPGEVDEVVIDGVVQYRRYIAISE